MILIDLFVYSRDRIVAMSTPWMTSGYPLYGKPCAFQGAMLLDCLYSVLRTGRHIPACRRFERRYAIPVKIDRYEYNI